MCFHNSVILKTVAAYVHSFVCVSVFAYISTQSVKTVAAYAHSFVCVSVSAYIFTQSARLSSIIKGVILSHHIYNSMYKTIII